MKKLASNTTGKDGWLRLSMILAIVALAPFFLGACAVGNAPIRGIDNIAPADVKSVKELRNHFHDLAGASLALAGAVVGVAETANSNAERLTKVEEAVDSLNLRVNSLEAVVESHEASNRRAFERLAAKVDKTAAQAGRAIEETSLMSEVASVASNQVVLVLPPFAEGSTNLSEAQKCALDKASAEALATTPTVRWEVVRGYASITGSAEINAKLAEARAKAVADYLATHGVEVRAEAPNPAKTGYRRAGAILYGTKP